MPSTYSTNLALELIGTGDQAGTWGNTTNTNLGTLIEQAISGYVTQAVATGTDTTITIPNGATGVARNMYIELTGTGGTNTNLIVPANKKLYFIFNNSTGAVTVKVSGQTGVSVPAGKKVVLVSNGTDVVNGLNYIADFGSNSATITTLSATSATITNLTLTSLVISNLSIASANITTLTSSSATISTTLALSGGTAGGVVYLDGSKVATSGSALTFDGTNLSNTRSVATAYSGTNSATWGNGVVLVNAATPATGVASLINFQGTSNVNNVFGVAQNASGNGDFVWASFTGSFAEIARLTASGNLGIGTTSPGSFYSLADNLVIGTGSGGHGMTIYSGSGDSGFIGFNDTASASMQGYIQYNHNGDYFAFAPAGTEKARLDSAGNLGLGVTPSAWESTWRAMQFGGSSGNAGSVYVNAGGTTGSIGLAQNWFFDGSLNKYLTTAAASDYYQFGGTHVWRTAPSGTAGNAITFTQAMTLNSSGLLYVGAISSALANANILTGGQGGGIQLIRNASGQPTSGQSLGTYAWKGADSANTNSAAEAMIEAVAAETFTGSTAATNLLFYTKPSGTGPGSAPTERMRIDSSGNLGIGTTSPATRLDVVGASAGSTVATFTSNETGSTTSLAVFQRSGGAVAAAVKYNASNSPLTIDFGTTTNHGLTFLTNNAERARITAGGNLLVKSTSALSYTGVGYAGQVQIANNGNANLACAGFFNGAEYGGEIILSKSRSDTIGTNTILQSGDRIGTIFFAGANGSGYDFAAQIRCEVDGSPGASTDMPGRLMFFTTADGSATPIERARITSAGDLLVGTTSVISSASNRGNITIGGSASSLLSLGTSASNTGYLYFDGGGTAGLELWNVANSFLRFGTNNSERARIDASGNFLVGITSVSDSATGAYIQAGGGGYFGREAATPLIVNRKTDDGTLVSFYQDSNTEGTISVSGNTVSYNAFAGSHWSQLQDGSKPDILRGTVMESINELCVWPGEQNERLPKAKISDTAGSKKVYGVFMAWDNDWTTTNDMYITAVGAFICRVNGSVTVQEGDLLESNGDGTARVQADDIIRSSTIGKVTSTVKTHQYDDGSYCVPTVLYCG